MASSHIVLKPSALNDKKYEKRQDQTPLFYGENVYRPESDEPNLSIHDDIMSPATRIPAIPQKFIKYVTYIGTICAGFRPDGVYKHGGAKLEAKLGAGRGLGERVQVISIRASGIKSARTIYDQFRQGNLEPDKKWSEQPSAI